MRRLLVVLFAINFALLGGTAHAHITVNPNSATQGGFTKLTFRAPNEKDDARTVKIEVFFPEDAPVAFVSTKPTPGWTAAVERRTLTTPIEAHGTPISEVVSKITWTGGSIGAGEFQEFEVSAGPLPEEADSMVFKALQTYDDGEVVRWIEEAPAGGEEPEHPAPVLELVAAPVDTGKSDEPADDGNDGLAVGLSVAALVVSLVAAGLAVFGRRRDAT